MVACSAVVPTVLGRVTGAGVLSETEDETEGVTGRSVSGLNGLGLGVG
jgi:hypothetical protein